MKKLVLAMLAASAMTVSAPLLAAPIVYTGFQQVGSIAANYSITTNGNIGLLNQSNITAFSFSLADSISTISFDQSTATANGLFNATSTTLSILGGTQFDLSANTNFNNFSRNISFDTFLTQAQIADMAHGGAINRSASQPNTIAFATSLPTVTPAVPEPATWAMMIAGFGMVGFAMRRRQKMSTIVRFA